MKYKNLNIYATLIVTLLFYLWIYNNTEIKYIDYRIYDFFSQKLDLNKKSKNSLKPSVVIVEIDQKSINTVGQWPWPRIVTANLINKINNANPSTIGFNIMFRQEDKSSISSIQKFYKTYLGFDLKIDGLDRKYFNNDEIFTQTMKNTKTILPVYLQDDIKINLNYEPIGKYANRLKNAKTTYKASSMLCNIEKLQKNCYSFGFINSKIDKDGILRRAPLFIKYKNSIVASFALENLLAIDKNIEFTDAGSVKILGHQFHVDDSSEVLLSFYKPNWYEKISAIDILDGKVSKEKLTGKIVLIGTSLISNNSRHVVTTADTFNGTDISATTIENILNDHLIWQPKILKIVNNILAFLLSIIALFLIQRFTHFQLMIYFVSIYILSFLIAVIFFQYNIYISISYFWIPLIIYFTILNIIMIYINDKKQKSYYQELADSHSSALESMVLVAATRDFETGAHLTRTKKYMKVLSQYLSHNKIYDNVLTKEFIDALYHTSPLHDIGKVGIPDYILKKKGKLDKDEFKTMKDHPKIGMEIIKNIMGSYSKNSFMKIAYNIAFYHHEKWDGSGYPNGLKKEEIPLEARLMALVDVYDALISKRCYKDAYSFEKAEEIIIDGSGTHFDPKIVEAFEELKDKFKEVAINNK